MKIGFLHAEIANVRRVIAKFRVDSTFTSEEKSLRGSQAGISLVPSLVSQSFSRKNSKFSAKLVSIVYKMAGKVRFIEAHS